MQRSARTLSNVSTPRVENTYVDLNALHEIELLFCKEVLNENLAKAGLYVIAYEMVKNSIVERPKGFFTMTGDAMVGTKR